jgi:pSer/pThr/pTyr-binding forkhead associated (FHA) protein
MTPSGTLNACKPYASRDGGRKLGWGAWGEVMRVILNVVEGPLKGRQFVLDRHDTFIVGRSRFVHCPMPEDLALSRDHFMIELNPPECALRDLGSTNGTYVNNRRVDRSRLASRDTIAAGQSVFRVEVEMAESMSSLDEPAGTKGRTASLAAGAIRCAGCDSPAPPNLTIAGPVGAAADEPVEWWCASCRSESANLPQPVPYYTCLRELGRGAMGVVYQARHNMTGRMVALKLIMPETATTRSAIDRFQREMSVISQIRHPNIVECYEQGMTRGQFWFAMEYVAGTNLEALAKADPGRYPVNQACRLTCQILKGLEEAHKLGFVHRDIKPENILIAQTAEGLAVKISDFGLAKSFRGVGLSGLTFSGEMRGTVPFMPPEQMLDFKTVTPLADLYATAATLYYMLTCQYVYDESAGGGDLIHMLLEESPIPIRDRRPDVPQALAEVIRICLARDPKERYPDAASMRKALKPFC